MNPQENSMRRTLIISLAVVAGLAVLGYLAHSMDLVGTIMRMHSPPQH
jgi:hypothetical protein